MRLSGKAYVLPRTGQQGIPLITVNTDLVKATIYRIGDRSLIDNVLGYDFERNLNSYTLDEIADQRGEKVWTGELKVEKELNQEITTAFPIMEAVPEMQPGVYLLVARPGNVPGDDYGERTTQWFIVSDLGLTAFSGTDGIHAYVNSLATTAPLADVEIRLLARNNDVLAVKKTDGNGAVTFAARACARRRRAGAGADRGVGRRRRLRLPQFEAIGVRSDRPGRGRTRRAARARCLRIHRARRLSHRRDRVCDGASARRRGHRRPRRRLDHGGRNAPMASSIAAPSCRTRGSADARSTCRSSPRRRPEHGASPSMPTRKGRRSGPPPSWSRTMCRIGSNSISPPKPPAISPEAPVEVMLDGRFLYGAPAAGLGIEGEVNIAKAAERPGYPGYSFGLDASDGADQDEAWAPRAFLSPICLLTDADGKAIFPVALGTLPASTKPLEANVVVRLAEPGGRAIERKLTLPDRAERADDRGEAALCRQVSQRQRHRQVRCRHGRARRPTDRRHRTQMATAQHRIQISVVSQQRLLELRADQGDAPRRRRHSSTLRPTGRARSRSPSPGDDTVSK